MSHTEQGTLLKAIQVITSREEVDPKSGKTNNVIKLVDKYKDGPSLKEVLCGENKDLPIFVFSITGKTRGGKSFLLDLMIKYLESQGEQDWKKGRMLNVFDWQGGKDSITKGLWICPKIYRQTNKYGNEVGILLMDNQGLFDGEQTDGESVALSGISTAISSYQMFNLKDKIATNDLENIWHHLVPDANNNSNRSEPVNTRLVFVVRDYLEEENGCGLDNGKIYIDSEKERGTEEHKFMWQSLDETFPHIQCLLLPYPGRAVTKKSYRDYGDMKDIEEDFLNEVDNFFKTIFSSSNLTRKEKNILTGMSIYKTLAEVSGKLADNDLSFFNVFTEHGNQHKLEKLIFDFESELKSNEAYFSKATVLWEDFLNHAKKMFKGKSAVEYLVKLREVSVKKINCLIKEWILERYESSFLPGIALENHNEEWFIAKQRMTYLVGDVIEKHIATVSIVVGGAACYYEHLRKDLFSKFQFICINKSLNELNGCDKAFVHTEFIECVDFQNSKCKAIRLKEEECLRQDVQDHLLHKVALLTNMDKEWLQNSSKLQYEYFEAFTWANAEKCNCHWNHIRKEDDSLLELISYVIFKKSQSLSEFQKEELDEIRLVADQIKLQSPQDPIKLSCIFVIYKDNDKEVSEPLFKVQNSFGVSFVDTKSRVYADWKGYKMNNKLPDCLYCYPLHGEYNNIQGFQVGFAWSPAAYVRNKVFHMLDKVGKLASFGSAAALGAATVTPTFPLVAVGGTVAAIASGAYGIGRSINKIVDKRLHNQSVSRRDVVNIVGNSLSVASFGVTAAVSALVNTGRNLLFAQTAFHGVSALANLVNGIEYDNTDSVKLPNDTLMRALLLFNGKTLDEAIENIKDSYDLGDKASKQYTLKSLIIANSVDSAIENGETQVIEQFVSTGLRSLVLDLSYEQATKQNLFLADIQFIHNITSTSEDLSVLQESFTNAPLAEKNEFFKLLMNLVYSISVYKGNSVYLKSYRGVEFHPVIEVLEQIDFAAISRGGVCAAECLDLNTTSKLRSILEKILRPVSSCADSNWSLQEFGEHLKHNWSKIVNSFDYIL